MRKRNRLAALIKRRGLTLRPMADASGVSPATISRVARGFPPDLETARKLARFFGLTIEALFPEPRP